MDSAGLTLTENDLRRIGAAADVSHAGGVATSDVYEIRGVSHVDAIVMRGDPAADTRPFLLFVSGPYPTGLCPYEQNSTRAPDVCDR